MTRKEIVKLIEDAYQEDDSVVYDIIIMLMDNGIIDIDAVNKCYTRHLQKVINEKDRIIKEADNCIFKSLFYDTQNKVVSSNVILDKVRWMYKYTDTNKDLLRNTFKYDPDKDTIE